MVPIIHRSRNQIGRYIPSVFQLKGVLTHMEFSEDLIDLIKELPDMDFELYKESIHRPLPECIRVNTLKLPEAEIVSILRDEGWELEKVPWARYAYNVKSEVNVGSSIYHLSGLLYIQGPLSLLPVEVLDVRPKMRVLDLCAAPGSKSTQIAQHMENHGVLVCNDDSSERIKPLVSNLQRFGVINHVVTLVDGRNYGRFARNLFDRVLVDVPCSSLGIVMKDWSIVRKYSKRTSEKISRLQLSLLNSAYDALRPGGYLVYSTCTIHPLENEWVINQLLEEREDARLLPVRPAALVSRRPLEEWKGQVFRSEIKNCFKSYPYDNLGEGFFVALVRKGENEG